MAMAARDIYLLTTTKTYLTHLRSLAGSASPTSPYPERLAPRPPDLVKWVRVEGGFVRQSITITQVDPYGLGLVATDEIPKGSDLIALPDHLPMRFESNGARDSAVLASLVGQVPEELWAMRLGLKLLQERAKIGSFWWPYISNLPETYSVPVFFPGEDIKNLQYAPLLHQVNKRCRFLLDFEREVKHAVENLKPDDHPFAGRDIDASSLGWAMSAVSSRAFRLYGEKLEHGSHTNVPMMLPLIDMCNHSFHPNAEIVREQHMQSSKMLVKAYYGFVIPSNPYDCVELKYDGALFDAASMAVGVSLSNFSSPAPWQQHVLSRLNLHGEDPVLKVSLGGPEIVEGRLLAALRALLANDMEIVQKHDLETLKSLSLEAPLGVSNDVAALRTLVALCVIVLGHFPTKIMEDESQLKQDVASSTELAIQLRIQKKSVIIDVMRTLSKRLKLLLSKESAASQI
ncbi:hypothetical protein RJ639_001224 [Escallonia herrerae]|uniref:SET domain-containing protein n=1 Tax=Escallonia herrerae TaxID=1293975 RepID=A0AA89BGP3_9ASTE|nr:hypothetical protein RJ639_001224 [Escallonia herrerae]